jgi:hypothetical protein
MMKQNEMKKENEMKWKISMLPLKCFNCGDVGHAKNKESDEE